MDAPRLPEITAPPTGGDAALLEALLAYSPAGISFLGPDRRYQRVNETLASMHGIPVEDHLGRTAPEALGEEGHRIDEAVRSVLATGTPVIGVEATTDAPDRPRHWRASYYPVDDADGARLGVAAVVEDVTERRESEAERERLLREALAARERAEAATAEAEAVRVRKEFLAAAGARMAAALDYEAALETVVAVAVPDLADAAVLTLAGPDGTLRAAAVASADAERAEVLRQVVGRRPARVDTGAGAARVMRTGEPEMVAAAGDAQLATLARDEGDIAALRALGLGGWLVLPLRGRERIIGALTLVQAESGRSFGDEEVTLAANLAARAALQLENARLSSERAEVAQTLQSSLLPQALPEIPGLEIAARYLAAGDATVVGGDFYDVFDNGDGSWTVLIGDVSGKGAGAAALTSLMRHTLRAAALRERSPAANLGLLNEILLIEGDGARFCTALSVRLEAGDGELRARIASGGHLPPYLLRPDGELRRLPVRGTLLGALPHPRFNELDVVLERGDVLVLHTDGVTELRGAEPEEGERRLVRVLARHAGREAETIAEAIERSAVGAQDGRPRDDIAVVALRVR